MFLNSKAQCVSCKVYFTNKVTLCFISVESENQSGSLKRLGSARQLPADLRALQSPLNTTFNPEGIYVWFCTGHQHSNTVCTSHMTPYHSETMKISFGEIIIPGITEVSVVCSTDSSTSSECFYGDDCFLLMAVWLIQPSQCFLQILQRHLQLKVCSLSLDPKCSNVLNMSWTWQLLTQTDRIHAASAYVQSINLLVQVRKCSIMMSFISRMFLNLQVNLILSAIMQAEGILGRCKEIVEDDKLCSLYFMAHGRDKSS